MEYHVVRKKEYSLNVCCNMMALRTTTVCKTSTNRCYVLRHESRGGYRKEKKRKMDNLSRGVYCGMRVELMLKMVASSQVQTVGTVM